MPNHKHPYFTFIIMAIFACFLTFWGTAAQAFDEGDYTETEKAGFAFYYFTNTNPNFEKWIKEYSHYKKAKPSRKNLLLQEDAQRLSRGMQSFNPATNYISFKTNARIHIPDDNQRREFMEKYNKIPLRIELPRILEIPGAQENYFPFNLGGEWFAMIPDNFQTFMTLYLDDQEYYDFTKNLDITEAFKVQTVTMNYIFRATSADTSEPFPIGSNNFWLIMAEVASIEIFNTEKNRLVWNYDASWYIPKAKQDLMNLYKQ